MRPTPGFLPGESQGQRSLAGCSPWGGKELDTATVTQHRGKPKRSVLMTKGPTRHSNHGYHVANRKTTLSSPTVRKRVEMISTFQEGTEKENLQETGV